MEAREIRIGNYLSAKGRIFVATHITIGAVANGYEEYKAVVLTEEIVLRLDLTIETATFKVYKEYNSVYYCVDLLDSNSYLIVGNIKHLHTLQNIYFAVTGIELTLK